MLKRFMLVAVFLFATNALAVDLRVRSAGNDIGQLVSFTIGSQPLTVVTNQGYFFSIQPSTRTLLQAPIFYSSSGCGGQAYAQVYGINRRVIYFNGSQYYYTSATANASQFNVSSYSYGGSCQPFFSFIDAITAIPLDAGVTGFTPPPGNVFPAPLSIVPAP